MGESEDVGPCRVGQRLSERAERGAQYSTLEEAGSDAALLRGLRTRLEELAVHLTQDWNLLLWERIAQLVEAGVPEHRRLPAVDPGPRRRRRLSSEQVDELVEAYKNGASIQAVALRHHIQFEPARSWLVASGVPVRPWKATGIPRENLAEASALREGQGWSWSWSKIGAKYGCSRTAAQNGILRFTHQAVEGE